MNNIEIRCATIEDATDIFEIDNEYEHERYSIESIKESLLNKFNYNIVLYVDDNPVGYLSAMIVIDECELLKIVVRKNYRRCGYGDMLIAELKKYCHEHDVTKIFLEVREDNVSGNSLYKKNGFVLDAKRIGYYNGVDAIIYRCDLHDKKD